MYFFRRIFKHKNSMSSVSLLYWEEKWSGLYATNHFTDKEECACKQNFRKIQKKYWSIYINGFWVLRRKITYSSLCQRQSAVSRGQEWLSQGEDISHKSTPVHSLCVSLIPSHQSAGEKDHRDGHLSGACIKSEPVATPIWTCLGIHPVPNVVPCYRHLLFISIHSPYTIDFMMINT